MTLDTKLREASRAIKDATRHAEFTSKTPGHEPRRQLTGPAFAWIGGLSIILLLGLPALLIGSGTPSTGGVVSQPVGDPTPSAEMTEPFPYLALDLPDTSPFEAYEITTDETGNRVGTHTVYHQQWDNDAGETYGREILLRVQVTGVEFPRFTELVALAESDETVNIAGRDVTVYVVPDDAIEEGNYDLGVLHWIEAPGIEAILIPWGLDRDGALDLMAGLHRMEPEEWDELTALYADPTTTTQVEPADQDSPSTTGASTNSAQPAGSPVSDQEFADTFLEDISAIVPGTARRLASTELDGLGTLELYSVRMMLPTFRSEPTGTGEVSVVEEGDPIEHFCLYAIGSFGTVGGAQCYPEPDIPDFVLAVDGSCDPYRTMLTIWGLNDGLTQVVVALSDGSQHTINPLAGGVALWAWDGNAGIADIEFDGASEQVQAEADRIDGYWLPEVPYFPCADSEAGPG